MVETVRHVGELIAAAPTGLETKGLQAEVDVLSAGRAYLESNGAELVRLSAGALIDLPHGAPLGARFRNRSPCLWPSDERLIPDRRKPCWRCRCGKKGRPAQHSRDSS